MLAKKLDKPGKVDLSEIKTDETGGMSKEEGEKKFVKLAAEMDRLQYLMYAAAQNGLLIVLQGRDTAGKDGTIRTVAGSMNPVGVRIASFKAPSPEELAHDFLWRVHAQAPARGQVVVFNRSHYEDVLVARVHNLVPKEVWERRFDHINGFEQELVDNGIIVVKFCLHISKEVQKERLLAREKEAEKAWKLNPEDWAERELWDKYTTAYEDALGRCVNKNAPWFVVPADHKWFRNVAVAEAIIEALKPHESEWDKKLSALGKTQRAALLKMREAQTGKAGKSAKSGKSAKNEKQNPTDKPDTE